MMRTARAGVVFAVVFGAVTLAAQVPKTDPAPPVSPPRETPIGAAREMTASDIESFLDGLVPSQLDRDDIAGAVIAIVKDGKVLFAKGYGYADTTNQSRVTTATLFRPGSISKLFTWTAVMQLVEQGKLDLDRDVNDYLDFQIPAPFGTPLTLRHIMTHTPGFEEAIRNLFVPDAEALMPLRDYVIGHLPNQIFAPGTVPAYSNYGTALAGYIVQRTSGTPFEDYVDTHIFKPLAMTSSTFRQPLPEHLRPLMSRGYQRASQGPKEYEFVGAFPAGSGAVSAMDMTRFMLAHLQGGEHEGARILGADTVKLMHARQFGLHPEINGMALGFYEESRNGHRIIGHGGDTVYFHSDMHLVPDQRLGVFISYNSAGKGESSPRTALWQKFLDRYLPHTPPPRPTPPQSAAADARTVSGHYKVSRRPDTTLIAFMNAPSQSSITTNADGTISADFARGLDGEPMKFRWIAPLTFESLDGQERLAFQRDSSGRLTIAVPFPAMMFQRTSGLEGQWFNVVVLVFSLGVIALALLLWPIGALVRRHYGRTLDLSRSERRLRRMVRIVCAVDIAVVMVILYLATQAGTPGAFNTRLDPMLRLFQALALAGTIGSVVAVVHAVRTATSRAWWGTKVQEALVALACIGFAWFVVYWHVLTPTIKY
ncbi:MAG: serine hydrolase domain-containing protein [Vicinamibacterales bacterium]